MNIQNNESLLSLPLDIHSLILDSLPMSCAGLYSMTCKKINELLRSENFWERRCQRDWGFYNTEPSWKEKYISLVQRQGMLHKLSSLPHSYMRYSFTKLAQDQILVEGTQKILLWDGQNSLEEIGELKGDVHTSADFFTVALEQGEFLTVERNEKSNRSKLVINGLKKGKVTELDSKEIPELVESCPKYYNRKILFFSSSNERNFRLNIWDRDSKNQKIDCVAALKTKERSSLQWLHGQRFLVMEPSKNLYSKVKVYVLDSKGIQLDFSFKSSLNAIHAIKELTGDRIAIIGRWCKRIEIWNLETRSLSFKIKARSDVFSLMQLSDGTLAVDAKDSISFWNPLPGTLIGELQKEKSSQSSDLGHRSIIEIEGNRILFSAHQGISILSIPRKALFDDVKKAGDNELCHII